MEYTKQMSYVFVGWSFTQTQHTRMQANVRLGLGTGAQGKVISVQAGFLGWILTKTHPGMEQIA